MTKEEMEIQNLLMEQIVSLVELLEEGRMLNERLMQFIKEILRED
jgi:hypothetical protein